MNYINYPSLQFFEGSTVDFWYAAPYTWDGIVGHSPLLGNWFTGTGATATGVPPGLTAQGYSSGGRGYLLITGTPTTPGIYSLQITMGSVTNTQTVTVLPIVTNRGLDWYPSEPNLTLDSGTPLPAYGYEIDSELTAASHIGWTGTNTYLSVVSVLGITNGSLPPGISISNNLGSINYGEWYMSGTPTTGGTYPVTFRVEFNSIISISSVLKYSNVRAYGSKSITFVINAVDPFVEVDAIETGYKVNGADLNTIFAGLSGLTPISPINIKVGATDLASLFAPLAEGTAAPATGYKISGLDINTRFAAKGSL